MTHVVTITEPTQGIRDWLRTKGFTAYAGGLPRDVTFPAIVVHRIGGAIQEIGPIDEGIYQFDCWASKASDASTLASDLSSLLLSTGTEALVTGLSVVGCNVTGLVFFPDDKRPDVNRMMVTAQVVTRTP